MRRRRPGFDAAYGISAEEAGMLDWSWAEERLTASRNYWVATSGEDGAPSSAPVWGVWLDGALWFGTSPTSRKGRNLERDPRAAIHLESGEEVVILHGEVERVTLEDAVADAYEAKYDYRPPGSEFLRLRPRRVLAWREHDFPQSATRFDFERAAG